ncbi:DNA-binding transcriptional MerR regulator [Paenibacillus rhizosphaerae]|uniref:DNA-binding transcriptional MerR regulator n=1 Tax=Paenibacillus rhizosphaerae TaxID=297318 RepID=A0A839TQ07_9BACL|nr:MerR family transcriptional regulator [Paenibacillus rhizosphaerae]MBB3129074.1 DNA-binding transcriptional MerR regulator [Paenibacillus rhizosphaerae]
MTGQSFTIKQTAELTGLSEDTIRYYEKIKLLPPADRKDNGHRVYRWKDIHTIKLISCLKKTGISLEAMRPFLKASGNPDPAEYLELAQTLKSHREQIVEQISSLQQLVDFIDVRLEKGCPSGEYPDQCPDDGLEAGLKDRLEDGLADRKEKTEAKPISVEEMSYFPQLRKRAN